MNPNLQRILMGAKKEAEIPFSPNDIADLYLWLDASQTNTLFADTAGTILATSSVARWNDCRNNGRFMSQSTLNAQPLTNIRTLNSLNVLDLDGSNDRFQSTDSGILSAIRTGFTPIIIYAKDTTNDARLLHSAQAGSSRIRLAFASSSTSLVFNHRTSLSVSSRTITAPGATPVISGYSRAAGSANLYPFHQGNSLTVVTNAQDILDGTVFCIGADEGGGSAFNGPIAEVLLYSRGLTFSELNQIGNYALSKWNSPWGGL